MSYHRYIVPPPLITAVHPAPPTKPKPVVDKDKKDDKDKDKKDEKDNDKDKKEVNDKNVKDKDAKDEKKKDDKDVKDNKDDKDEKPTDDKEEEPEEIPPPLKLAGPAPPQPVRAKLDLDPSRPYPPIPIDPRGAYHKYAKGVQAEVMYIDVTKDGWLTEQWKERPEREALALLTGEAEKQRQRELRRLKEEKLQGERKVPDTAEGILRELWNDLAQARSYEIPIEEFWAKYDFSSPEAQKHLRPSPKRPPPEPENKDKDKEGRNPKKTTKVEEDPDAPSWTREGFEEVLATVGIQCSYNAPKPLPRDVYEPNAGYLILAHGHFLLRMENQLQWKAEATANNFEMLVTSAHDRVFGDMVKAQQAEERKKKEKEYRERKEREKKEKEAKEAKEGKEDKDSKEKDDKENKDGKDNKEDKEKEEKDNKDAKDAKEKDKKEDKKEEEDVPMSPLSNVKVLDGEPIERQSAPDLDPDVAILALPVKDEKAKNLDEQHDADVRAVPHKVKEAEAEPDKKEAKDKDAKDENAKDKDGKDKDIKDKDGKDKDPKDKDAKDKDVKDKDGKDKDPKDKDDKKAVKKDDKKHGGHGHGLPNLPGLGNFDPERDAALLAKMLADPAAAGMGMSELKAAFKALEMAADAGIVPHLPPMPGMSVPFGDKKDASGNPTPLIWTWKERCEKWRWGNYVAGVHDVAPGGWEERDWRVFADDRGCEQYDEEEEACEVFEVDIHDWSC
ncbi:hypothetical protein M231_04122 [Tremella mesenterica]|uniref:Uncharacterized protein n=1 Tax=Tremella mesenterica TaxID=5217 RepID=A0A4Q1BLI8_TREME|nr:hypothetical protein M231_04122 [Tremella mesenterica]